MRLVIHKWINIGGGENDRKSVLKSRQTLNRLVNKRKQNNPISSAKKSLTTKRFFRFVANLTTMLINIMKEKKCACSRFRFSALFFNLEACLQPLITAHDKSSCLLYIKANTIGVKKCEHTFLLWTFEMRNMIFWELPSLSLINGLSLNLVAQEEVLFFKRCLTTG